MSIKLTANYNSVKMHGVPYCFFFNDTSTTVIYTLSLHDALPISRARRARCGSAPAHPARHGAYGIRSEEHTSELQSQSNIVCRLLLEKKNNKNTKNFTHATSTCSGLTAGSNYDFYNYYRQDSLRA